MFPGRREPGRVGLRRRRRASWKGSMSRRRLGRRRVAGLASSRVPGGVPGVPPRRPPRQGRPHRRAVALECANPRIIHEQERFDPASASTRVTRATGQLFSSAAQSSAMVAASDASTVARPPQQGRLLRPPGRRRRLEENRGRASPSCSRRWRRSPRHRAAIRLPARPGRRRPPRLLLRPPRNPLNSTTRPLT